ncbi:fibronectin type III domain-containing protein [bacterium]|nr:fibronectin type III domain-containing protein [bacterium]
MSSRYPRGRDDREHGAPATFTGLTNGTAYTFTIQAVNSIGSSAESAASEGVTPNPAITTPGAPTDVVATGGRKSATVTFTAPANNGGTEIVQYTVTSTPGGITASHTASPIMVSGLTNGTSYSFTVVAINGQGAGELSVASNAVTPQGVPDAPTTVSASAGDAQATITFNAPADTGGLPITGYEVTSNPGAKVATGTGSPIVVAGLTNGTLYTFTVVAINAQGKSVASEASNSVTPSSGVPGPPYAGSGNRRQRTGERIV